MTIEKFIPEPQDKCLSCKGKVDTVGLRIGSIWLVLCNSCSRKLVPLLLDSFYPAWRRGECSGSVAEGSTVVAEGEVG